MLVNTRIPRTRPKKFIARSLPKPPECVQLPSYWTVWFRFVGDTIGTDTEFRSRPDKMLLEPKVFQGLSDPFGFMPFSESNWYNDFHASG